MKVLEEESIVVSKERLASTQKMEAQALRDNLGTEYADAQTITESVNEDVLRTVGHKEEQLYMSLVALKRKVNK